MFVPGEQQFAKEWGERSQHDNNQKELSPWRKENPWRPQGNTDGADGYTSYDLSSDDDAPQPISLVFLFCLSLCGVISLEPHGVVRQRPQAL